MSPPKTRMKVLPASNTAVVWFLPKISHFHRVRGNFLAETKAFTEAIIGLFLSHLWMMTAP
jgi:hypothetical protein